MSRSGYYDDGDGTNWDLIRWRGAVVSAIKGRRGQQLLREMLAALDAMPEKRLIAGDLLNPDGEVCALGAVGRARNMPNLGDIDPEDYEQVAREFGISEALAREIMFENDDCWRRITPEDRWAHMRDCWRRITPEDRWTHMRAWVAENIKESA